MPLYDYKCPDCHCENTLERNMDNAPPWEMPCYCGRTLFRVHSFKSVIRFSNKQEEGQRIRKQLSKRMADHEKTPGAREERRNRIRELKNKGYPV